MKEQMSQQKAKTTLKTQKRKAMKKDVFSLIEAFSIRLATKTDLVLFHLKENRKDGDWITIPK